MSPFSWLAGLLGRRPQDTSPSKAPPGPGVGQPPLAEVILAGLDPVSGMLPSEGYALPDDERAMRDGLRWAPGAMDGTWGHHMGAQSDPARVEALFRLVNQALRRPGDSQRQALYRALREAPVLNVVDGVLETLADDPGVPRAALRELALWLITRAPDREPLKFGIALLGPVRQPEDEPLLLALGAHDEFTLYAATALQQNQPDPARVLWALARRTRGWGRIHTVGRLARLPGLSPEVQEWLLREGFQNNTMPEYLAYACAVGGCLHERLRQADSVDDDLMKSTGDLLLALIQGGPAEDMDDYPQGAVAVEAWLSLLESRPLASLDCLVAVGAIRDFIDADAADWAAREKHGWHAIRRNRVRHLCGRIMAQPHWRPLVQQGMTCGFQPMVLFSARLLGGTDPWPWIWECLRRAPRDPGLWAHIMQECPESHLPEVLALAENSLPLEAMASGPADELGLGPGFEPYHCLDVILQRLKDFPGAGQPLVMTALNAPVIRNRNLALQVLQAWSCPLDAPWRATLEQLLFREPNPDTREHIKRLLRSQPAAQPPGEPGPRVS